MGLAWGLAMGFQTQSAWAVVVFVRGSDQPIGGYVVKEDAESLVLRESAGPGQARERTFRKADLTDVIVTVRKDRLEQLRPETPRAYRDYAEELAEKRRDPEARDMAIRLFLIAAWLDPGELGQGALLAMVDLARDPEEASRFRAAAYLQDPRHDPQILKSREADSQSGEARGSLPNAGSLPNTGSLPGAGNAASNRARGAATSPALLAIRQLRRGDVEAARRIAERDGVREEFRSIASIIDYDGFLAACKETKLPAETFRKLLAAELQLIDLSGAVDRETARRSNAKVEQSRRWSQSIGGRRESLAPSFDLRRITEFDPSQCRFREGAWSAP